MSLRVRAMGNRPALSSLICLKLLGLWVQCLILQNADSEQMTVGTGKRTVPIPPYMTLNQDVETKKATLIVQDKDVRKQREMWGQPCFLLSSQSARH